MRNYILSFVLIGFFKCGIGYSLVVNTLGNPQDPNNEIRQSIVDFSKCLELELNDQINFGYLIYVNMGHVPYSSFYDGMEFIYEKE